MWTKMQIFVALLWCAVGSASQRLHSFGCRDVGLVNGESKCSSCSEVSFCVGGRVSSVKCGTDQACYQEVGSASCLPVDRTPCNVCDEDRHSACDPYNDTIINKCTRGQAPEMLETCPGNQACLKGACIAGPKPSSTKTKTISELCDEDIDGDHFVVIKPSCTTAVLCTRNESGAIAYECDEGYYFDPLTVSCELYPIDNCIDTLQGFAPDRTNCSMGVVCEGGQQVSTFYCGDYHMYDSDTDTCVDETLPHTCPELEGCGY